MLTALAVAVLIVAVLAWRVDRLKAQVRSLRASRDVHARALRYSGENAGRGVHIVRVDTARGRVWVQYSSPQAELHAPQALQKILAGTWVHMTGPSTAGQAVYQYRAPRPPRPGAEQR